jgi:hypothetical protein
MGGLVWGRGRCQVEEQEDWRNDKWGGARPAAAQERRKRASAAVTVREKGMKERGGCLGHDRCAHGPAEGVVAFSI